MSLKENERWLEDANVLFIEHLEDNNLESAYTIMWDVKEAGFEKEYQTMLKQFTHAKYGEQ